MPFSANTIHKLNPQSQLKGHTKAVTAGIFSPDGQMFASASRDGTIRLWNTTTGEEIRKLAENVGYVSTLLFSADGEYLYSTQEDGIYVRPVTADGGVTSLRYQQETVYHIVLVDNHLISASENGAIRLWDVQQGEMVELLHDSGAAVKSLACNGNVIAACMNNSVVLWDAITHDQLTTINTNNGVNSVALSHQYLATGASIGAQLYSLETYEAVGDSIKDRFITNVSFNADGSILAMATTALTGAGLWDAESAGLITRAQTGSVLAFSDNMIASGGLNSITLYTAQGAPETAILGKASSVIDGSNIPNLQSVAVLQGHQAPIYALDFHPSSQLLASCGADRSVQIWDVDSGAIVSTLQGHQAPVQSVGFTKDGATLISFSGSFAEDGEVRFWDVETWQEQEERRIEKLGSGAPKPGMALSPDGTLMAVGSRVYEIATGAEIQHFSGNQAGVNTPAFNHDGSLLALAVGSDTGNSGQVDNAIKLYNLQTGEEIAVFRNYKDWVLQVDFVMIRAFGELISGFDRSGTFYGFSVANKRPITGGSGITTTANNPTSNLLIMANVDKTLRVFDLNAGGGDGHQLAGHEDRVNSIAFSPDGRMIASGSSDMSIRLWGIM